MSAVTFEITDDGPIVRILISASTNQRKVLEDLELDIPEPVLLDVLIDTGASCTSIDANHLALLKIQPTGITDVMTPSTGSTPVQFYQYEIDLAIELSEGQFKHFQNVSVIQSDLRGQYIEGLAGRDLLSQGVFIYDGPGQRFSLAY